MNECSKITSNQILNHPVLAGTFYIFIALFIQFIFYFFVLFFFLSVSKCSARMLLPLITFLDAVNCFRFSRVKWISLANKRAFHSQRQALDDDDGAGALITSKKSLSNERAKNMNFFSHTNKHHRKRWYFFFPSFLSHLFIYFFSFFSLLSKFVFYSHFDSLYIVLGNIRFVFRFLFDNTLPSIKSKVFLLFCFCFYYF